MHDQTSLPLRGAIAGLGHNHPPEPINTVDALDLRLAKTHRDLVIRFLDLELGCSRVPEPIDTEEQAAMAADFIAQCQAHIKSAEKAHKSEKDFFLKGGRMVDAFFKRRSEKLSKALIPVMARLKAYRDQRIANEEKSYEVGRHEAAIEAERAEGEAVALRAEANRLLEHARSPADREAAAEQLRRADHATARAAAAREAMLLAPAPVEIRGEYGSAAYVRRSWTFEVVDLDQVPREYMSLDVEVVRNAIQRDGVRHIGGLRIYQNETLHVRGAV
jgi:hypothetical protein